YTTLFRSQDLRFILRLPAQFYPPRGSILRSFFIAMRDSVEGAAPPSTSWECCHAARQQIRNHLRPSLRSSLCASAEIGPDVGARRTGPQFAPRSFRRIVDGSAARAERGVVGRSAVETAASDVRQSRRPNWVRAALRRRR